MHENKKMRLLIMTQKVDMTDPILGFFHRWIEEFSKQCETVTVIGQKVGPHDLPDNVRVLSLGKEDGVSNLEQVRRFRSFIKQENYDAVLVHMTPIWVVLGIFAFKKSVYLWYEARGARWSLHVALHMVRKVFSASKAGMPIASPKSVITGHGIDTALFSPSKEERDPTMMITVGRVTASKHLIEIVDCVKQLTEDMDLLIVGTDITPDDKQFRLELMKHIREIFSRERVHFANGAHAKVIRCLQTANIFLHASTTSLDKAVLEAMACGYITVSSAEAFKNVLPPECVCTNGTMAETVKKILAMPKEKQAALRKELREIVVKHHSLPRLIELLVHEMSS